jgi:hypothetical protein
VLGFLHAVESRRRIALPTFALRLLRGRGCGITECGKIVGIDGGDVGEGV